MAPAAIYRSPDVPAYFPTPLTEHYPVIHAAKHALGLPVLLDTDTVVQHADTARYGPPLRSFEADDGGPQWEAWLAPFRGRRFDDPALRETPVPVFWDVALEAASVITRTSHSDTQ